MSDQKEQTQQWPQCPSFQQPPYFQTQWNQNTQQNSPIEQIAQPSGHQFRQPYFPPQEPKQFPIEESPAPTTYLGMPNRPLRRLTSGKLTLYIGIFILISGILYLSIQIGFTKVSTGSHQATISTKPAFPPIGTALQSFYSSNGATSFGHLGWSQDGLQLFSVRMNGTVQIWNTTTWNNTATYVIPFNLLTPVSWSPDKQFFASTSFLDPQGTVRVWNTLSEGEVLAYQGHSNTVNAIAWSPDGTRIASGGFDKTVQIWDARIGNTIFTYHTGAVVWSIAWSPDGTRIASASDSAIQVWNVATGNTLLSYHGHPDGAWRLAWSPDGKYIASAGSKEPTVQVWDATNGNQFLTYHGHTEVVMDIAWSPDGSMIITSSDDKTAQIWNAITGKNIYIYHGHTSVVADATWSPDGRFIASSASDGTVKVWWAV